MEMQSPRLHPRSSASAPTGILQMHGGWGLSEWRVPWGGVLTGLRGWEDAGRSAVRSMAPHRKDLVQTSCDCLKCHQAVRKLKNLYLII